MVANVSAGEVRGAAGRSDIWLPVALLILAGLGWWWSAVSAGDMSAGMGGDGMSMEPQPTMSFVAFLVAWVAMMAAMMFPAVVPVVRLYARAAANGQAAPVVGLRRRVHRAVGRRGHPRISLRGDGWNEPLMHGSPWAGRVAGAVAVAAGLYQLTPLKSVCLRHCRSPLSFFLRHGKHLDRPTGAFVAGGRHGNVLRRLLLDADGRADRFRYNAIGVDAGFRGADPAGEGRSRSVNSSPAWRGRCCWFWVSRCWCTRHSLPISSDRKARHDNDRTTHPVVPQGSRI